MKNTARLTRGAVPLDDEPPIRRLQAHDKIDVSREGGWRDALLGELLFVGQQKRLALARRGWLKLRAGVQGPRFFSSGGTLDAELTRYFRI